MRIFVNKMFAAFIVAAGLPSAVVAADDVDVRGLECHLAFESDRDSAFKRPDGARYLYMVLQAPSNDRAHVDSALQFPVGKAEPSYLLNPLLGKATAPRADAVFFNAGGDAVEEPFSFEFNGKSLKLTTYQSRIPNYVVGDYVNEIFKLQPKWSEIEGDVDTVREAEPTVFVDGIAQYVMRFACRDIDPGKLRAAARARNR